MTWFYVENGKQAGPVDEAQLDEFARGGKIQAETLVWREGMAAWQSYAEARGGASAAPNMPPMSAPPVSGVVCAECGRLFAPEDTIQYGDARVCAACKPLFVQKLAEGGQIAGVMNYAGFWIRFGAVFIDGLLLWVVNFAIGLAFGGSLSQSMGAQPTAAIGTQFFLMALSFAIGISYEVFFIGKYGATLGKKACKIKVVTAEGAPVTYARAFGRYFAKIVSGLTCAIGYIMAGFDDQKRALHDRICNTRVILVG